jgi:molybdopterin-guanine dinucleotide biosynthesis protein A
MQAAGYVLVGGNSSRMERDKAFLPGQFRYILDDVAESVRAAAGTVTLIGNPDRYREFQYHCLADLRPGLGPLSGLETALASTDADLNLVLACDMPALDVDHLRLLIRRAQTACGKCVATEDVTGRIHPLCAVYRRECLPVIQCRLDQKRLSLMGLLDEVGTEYVRVSSAIENLNTPEEWARWSSKQPKKIHPAWQIQT